MKKQFLIILTLVLSVALVYAQELKPNSIIKANKTTFKTNEVKMFGDQSGYMTVMNVNNIYHSRKPKNPSLDVSTLYARKEKGNTLKAFKQVFSDERLKQLASIEHGLTLTLDIGTSGKVLEVEFSLRKNTILTAAELEQLENAIKSNLSFKIHPEETKGIDFFALSFSVIYQNILDRIER